MFALIADPMGLEKCTMAYARVLSRFSRDRLCATLGTVAHQAPLSRGFSRQGYWSGLPCPSPGDLPDLGMEPESLKSPALVGKDTAVSCRALLQGIFPTQGSNPKSLTSPQLAGGFFITSTTWKAHSRSL